MKVNFALLEQKIASLLESSPPSPKTFDRSHIFHNIIESCADSIPVIDKMNMYHRFLCYEKSLSEGHQDNLRMSKYWIDYVDKFPLQLEGKAEIGMKSLYYPMVAFYHYAKQEYDEAIRLIETSLNLVDSLIEHQVTDALLDRVEQMLNLYRIYITKDDWQQASRYGASILHFVYTGGSNHLLSGDLSGAFAADPPGTWEAFANLHTNAILRKVGQKKKILDPKLIAPIFTLAAQEKDWSKSPIPTLQLPVRAIAAFHEGDHATFEHYAGMALDYLPDYPVYIQYFLLEYYRNYSCQNSDGGLLDRYYRSHLQLSEKVLN